MKTFVRRLARVRHSLYGTLLLGVLTAGVGLVFRAGNVSPSETNPLLAPMTLVVVGAAAALLATVLVVATYHVERVSEGVIVELQQPQLPDVQVHTHPHTDLPRVA
jgi:hypothetical protein